MTGNSHWYKCQITCLSSQGSYSCNTVYNYINSDRKMA